MMIFSKHGTFSKVGRSATIAAVAALALTSVAPTMAFAGTAPARKGLSTDHGMTDVSARRRVYRHYRGGGGAGGAAAAAAFVGIVGTGLAIAASRDRGYYGDGYYGGGPAYYGGPGYYGGGPYYGYRGY